MKSILLEQNFSTRFIINDTLLASMESELEKFMRRDGECLQGRKLESRESINECMSDHPNFDCAYGGQVNSMDTIIPAIYNRDFNDELFVTYLESFYQDIIDGKPVVDFILHGFTNGRNSIRHVPVRTIGSLYLEEENCCSSIYSIEKMSPLPVDYDPLVHYRSDE